MAFHLRAGDLDRFIELWRNSPGPDASGYVANNWVKVASVWAQVRDALPSRAERVAENINLASRPCRVRMRYRVDVDSSMRLKIDGRIYSIVAGPAELGRRVAVEVMAEELSTMGDGA